MKQVPYLAPDFELFGNDGKKHKLSDYKGNWLVLYFYPKDNTPGCTLQACSVRDNIGDLSNKGITVVGVSADNENSHLKFISDHKLNFLLLSDESKEVIEKYGAWGKKAFGKEGILRKAFIINPKGQVIKIYGRAKTEGFAERILADFAEINN